MIETSLNSLHIQFASIGSGFYPTHYAFYFQLPVKNTGIIESAEAEAWENNLVLNISLNSNSNLQLYYAGLDKSDLKEYIVQDNFLAQNFCKQTNQLQPELQSPPLEVSVERLENEKTIEIKIKPREVSCNDDTNALKPIISPNTTLSSKKQRKRNKKRRSLSESACDKIIISYNKKHQEKHHTHPVNKKILNPEEDLNSSIEHGNDVQVQKQIIDSTKNNNEATNEIPIPTNAYTQRKQRSYSECRDNSSAPSFKSILKHYSRYDRNLLKISDSCSSIDDQFCSSASCSIDAVVSGLNSFSNSFRNIPEEREIRKNVDSRIEGDYLSESFRKKTVRFNEVIRKQFFR